jgi:uncharacterized membrane protein
VGPPSLAAICAAWFVSGIDYSAVFTATTTGMAASIPTGLIRTATLPPSRFASESRHPVSGEWSMQWLLKKNCSIAPRQLFGAYVFLCFLSLGIAGGFWLKGATLVLPFAGAELLALAVAMLIHTRHATDGEDIRLGGQALTVVCTHGGRVERVEFEPAWVRVEPEHGDRSLIELSGQGRRVAVGRFVRPELRRQLAEEFRWALRRWHPGVAHVMP